MKPNMSMEIRDMTSLAMWAGAKKKHRGGKQDLLCANAKPCAWQTGISRLISKGKSRLSSLLLRLKDEGLRSSLISLCMECATHSTLSDIVEASVMSNRLMQCRPGESSRWTTSCSSCPKQVCLKLKLELPGPYLLGYSAVDMHAQQLVNSDLFIPCPHGKAA